MKNGKKHFSSFRHKFGKKNRKNTLKQKSSYLSIHGISIPLTVNGRKEENLWKGAGFRLANSKLLSQVKDGEEIYVFHNRQKAVLKVSKYGKKINFKLVSNDINLDYSHYETKKLRKIDVETNSHLFYDFVPNSMGDITFDVGAHFGRIGMHGKRALEEGSVLQHPFPSCLFWLKYYQKLNEGFTDETDSFDIEDTNKTINALFTIQAPEEEEDDAENKLYDMLVDSSKEALSDFNIDWFKNKVPFSQKTIDACWNRYDKLVELSETGDSSEKLKEEANKIIIELIKKASPTFKRGTTVKSFLIKDNKFSKNKNYYLDALNEQIQKWETRIRSMEAVCANPTKADKKKNVGPKGLFGTSLVRYATDEEFKHIQELIEKECPTQGYMLKKVFMLECPERKKKYEDALSNSKNKTEKELFHGSDTANMISLIACGGPTMDHAAYGMFGKGLYFAPSFDKSLGYSSIAGSYWNNGTEQVGYMLVNKVHYGSDYRPSSTGDYCRTVVQDNTYDCCHARATDCGLRRDEIITYDNEHSYTEAILQFAY